MASEVRQVVLVDQEVLREGGHDLAKPTRRVAAAAVLENPLAGKPFSEDLSQLVELSVRTGELLTARALEALTPLKPRGYGKAALVGTEGTLGVQADVKDVSGIWKELTDNVNMMANNLTNQVRDIAEVTTLRPEQYVTKAKDLGLPLAYMIAMPGASHAGPLPPLTADTKLPMRLGAIGASNSTGA